MIYATVHNRVTYNHALERLEHRVFYDRWDNPGIIHRIAQIAVCYPEARHLHFATDLRSALAQCVPDSADEPQYDDGLFWDEPMTWSPASVYPELPGLCTVQILGMPGWSSTVEPLARTITRMDQDDFGPIDTDSELRRVLHRCKWVVRCTRLAPDQSQVLRALAAETEWRVQVQALTQRASIALDTHRELGVAVASGALAAHTRGLHERAESVREEDWRALQAFDRAMAELEGREINPELLRGHLRTPFESSTPVSLGRWARSSHFGCYSAFGSWLLVNDLQHLRGCFRWRSSESWCTSRGKTWDMETRTARAFSLAPGDDTTGTTTALASKQLKANTIAAFNPVSFTIT